MTDIRTRLATLALSAIAKDNDGWAPPQAQLEQVIDALLSLPGIAVVELPEWDTILPTLDEIAGLRYYFGTEKGLAIAAALLAAANAADGLGVSE